MSCVAAPRLPEAALATPSGRIDLIHTGIEYVEAAQ